MRTIRTIKTLHAVLAPARHAKKKIGFVPTMGALHKGHAALLRRARRDNDIVVLSIFVNPAQFGPHEDFRRYPRQQKKDELLAKKENVDIIFYPSEKTIYPTGFLTYVTVDDISTTLCGASRPGHFRGVTTVVAKLLNIVLPTTLYLGQKDAQQAIIIAKMVADLNIRVRVVICPTVREPDGLALSSRNVYLTDQQRSEAPIVYQSLREAKKKILAGERNATAITTFIKKHIEKGSSGTIDYIACVDAQTLTKRKTIYGKTLLALAVKFTNTRLIDNISIQTR